MRIPVIDLFAGPGGLNEGFSSVRNSRGAPAFETLVSVECEPWAHRTLELRALFRKLRSNGKAALYYRYVRGEITREALFEKAGSAAVAARSEALHRTLGKSPEEDLEIENHIDAALKRANADEFVLIGGPPCQAYSLVGRARRAKELRSEFEADHKHVLYREYLRIVRKFRPAMFLMENVPGLLSASLSGSRTFDLIKSDLSSAGYNLFPLNAASEETHQADDPRLFIVRAEDYGVPQARARVFILGLRSDLGLKPLTLDAAATATNSVWDAICDLPRIRSKLTKATDSGEEWLETIRRVGSYDLSGVGLEFEMKLLLRLSKMQSRLPLGSKAMAPTGKPHAILRDWLRDEKLDIVLNHNSRGHMPRDLMRYFFWSQYAAHFGRSPKLSDVPHYLRPAHGNVQGDAVDVPFADRFRVQLRGRPSTTITSHIAKDGHYYIHPDPSQCRSLSVREAARLQTFPDNYFFEGAATDQYKQVGNAVPPYLAYQIGQLVARVLGK